MRTSALSCLDDPVHVREPRDPPEADVLAGAQHEAGEILEEHRDPLVDPGRLEGRDIDAVPSDAARIGAVEPREDLRERRLSRAVLADQGDDLPGVDLERDVVERESLLLWRSPILRVRSGITE